MARGVVKHVSVILLVSLTKARQYCDADEILQKATTVNTYIIFFEEVGQKVVIYDVMTISFCLLLTTFRGFGAEDARLLLGGITTIFY